MTFKNPYNANEFEKNYEKRIRPSMTIPDQTMTVKEILDRYARGLPIDGQKTPIYEGDDDFMPDPRTLDLAERQQLKEEAQQELQEIKSRLSKPKTPPNKPESQKDKPTQEETPLGGSGQGS